MANFGGFTLIAIPVPNEREALEFTEESLGEYADYLIDTLHPSLYLFVLASPPEEARQDLLDALVTSSIAAFLHGLMLTKGAPLPPALLNEELMGRLVEDVRDGSIARLNLIIAEVNNELRSLDD